LYFELTGLFVSLAALIASIAIGWISIRLTKEALRTTKQVADRSREDWRQQKWFDLYLESNTAYDLLDRFQHVANTLGGVSPTDIQSALDHAVLQFRKVNALAMVFPVCGEIDALCNATSGITGQADANSQERLKRILDASEGIRVKALMDADILRT